jgi:hypothetical protein
MASREPATDAISDIGLSTPTQTHDDNATSTSDIAVKDADVAHLQSRTAHKRKRDATAGSYADTKHTPSNSTTLSKHGRSKENRIDRDTSHRPGKKQKTGGSSDEHHGNHDAQTLQDEDSDGTQPESDVQSAQKTKVSQQAFRTKLSTIKTFTHEEVRNFFDGVAKLNTQNDWASQNMAIKYAELIRWHDGMGMGLTDCVEKYMQSGYSASGRVSYTYLHRVYNEKAPALYTEKGIVFVPLSKRQQMTITSYTTVSPSQVKNAGQSTIVVESPLVSSPGSKPGSPSPIDKEPVCSKEDRQLGQLFSKVHCPQGLQFGKAEPKINVEVSQEDKQRFEANQYADEVLSFRRKARNMHQDQLNRLVVRADAALRHSTVLRDALESDEQIGIVHYDNIEEVTISRWVACVSPGLRASLPTLDLVEVFKEDGSKELQPTLINWTMEELKNLYMFAVCLQSPDVCNLVIDRVYQEWQRPMPRMVCDEFGRTQPFDVVALDPAFVNCLAKYDAKGFNFFTDLLVMEGAHGWNKLQAFGLDDYDKMVKVTLKQKLEGDLVLPIETKDSGARCKAYHHHEDGYCCPNLLLSTSAASHALPSRHFANDAEDDLGVQEKAQVQENEHTKNGKRKRRPLDEEFGDEDDVAHTRKKVKNKPSSWDSSPSSSEAGNSDNDRQDGHSFTIALPIEYTNAPRVHPDVQEVIDSLTHDSLPARPLVSDRIIYHGRGMNSTKDSEEIALRKFLKIQRKLRLFRSAGYNVADEKFAPEDDDEPLDIEVDDSEDGLESDNSDAEVEEL